MQRTHQPDIRAGDDERAGEDGAAENGDLTSSSWHRLCLDRRRSDGGSAAQAVDARWYATSSTPVSTPVSSEGQRGEVQAVLQHGDREQAEQRAPEGAAPAEDRCAAEHDGGDRVKLVAGAGVRLGLPEMRDVDDRGEARDQAGEDVDQRQTALRRECRRSARRLALKPMA